MRDRNVQYPNRYRLRPVAGTDDIFEIIPAPGTVYEDGTFWNKANVLRDLTAALYGLGPDAVPDDIFAAIRPLITAAHEKIKITCGSYTGTGEAQTIAFDFKPLLFCCTGRVKSSYSSPGALAIGVGDLIVGSYSSGTASYSTNDVGTISGNTVHINNRFIYAGMLYHYIAIG